MNFYTVFITLFLLMDHFGNIPVFLATLNKIRIDRHNPIIIRESFIAFVILSIFFFFGQSILQGMELSVSAVQISGGVILFLMAIKMIYPSEYQKEKPEEGEPFIVPLATPLIAGPSTLAMVMIIGQNSNQPMFFSWLSILGACVASGLVLLCGNFLRKILGMRVMLAIERLMGMILTTLAAQMLLDGISHSINNLFIANMT